MTHITLRARFYRSVLLEAATNGQQLATVRALLPLLLINYKLLLAASLRREESAAIVTSTCVHTHVKSRESPSFAIVTFTICATSSFSSFEFPSPFFHTNQRSTPVVHFKVDEEDERLDLEAVGGTSTNALQP